MLDLEFAARIKTRASRIATQEKLAGEIESSVHDRVKGDVIVSSDTKFRDSYSVRGMSRYEMPEFSPDKLKWLFEGQGKFYDELKECSLNELAHIRVKGNEYSEIPIPPRDNQKIVAESIEMVEYWKGLFEERKNKFISGLNGCNTRLRSNAVCHVVLKLALQTEGVPDDIKRYYMVGELSRDRGYGEFTHVADFFLVEEEKLEELDDGTFKVAVEDNHQRLDWSCNVPEEAPLEVARLVVKEAPREIATVETVEALVAEKVTGAVSLPSSTANHTGTFRCCCYEDATGVHAVGVKVMTAEEPDAQAVAIGHWGNHAGNEQDQACPVISPLSGDGYCACATKNAGFSWVARSKCIQPVGIPTHSQERNMSSDTASKSCESKCGAQSYEAEITTQCTAE
jgi:hypothetical protein